MTKPVEKGRKPATNTTSIEQPQQRLLLDFEGVFGVKGGLDNKGIPDGCCAL
jgi:hypothetical protein